MAAIADSKKAEKRHLAAMKKLREERSQTQEEENRHIVARFNCFLCKNLAIVVSSSKSRIYCLCGPGSLSSLI